MLDITRRIKEQNCSPSNITIEHLILKAASDSTLKEADFEKELDNQIKRRRISQFTFEGF